MAFDSHSLSQSFVLSEITLIASGQSSSILSNQTQTDRNSLHEMGIESFALTPMLEKHLLQLAADRSEARMRIHIDIIFSQLFQWMLKIQSLATGHVRAATVQKLMEHSIASNPDDAPVSCRRSCAFCCHTPVSVTRSEVDGIYSYLETQRIHWNQERAWSGSKGACVFLSRDNSCSIYEARPLACRKLMAVSPAELCNSEELNQPSYLLYIEAELIAAAFYNIESNSDAAMKTISEHFQTNLKRKQCRPAIGSNSVETSETDDI